MSAKEMLSPTASVWLQVCPKCRQLWFIGMARAEEAYRCKACGREFLIGHEHLPPTPDERKGELVKR